MKKLVLKGDVIFTPTRDKFEVHENSYLVGEDGKVVGIFKELKGKYRDYPIIDATDKMIIPGFVDIHLHAPQYANIGIGYDKELLPWLKTYTFPEESRFLDIKYAEKIYSKFIKDLWKHGTTSAVIFGTIHKESTMLLMDLIINSGLRAYVGKVNMDINSIESLLEDTETSLKDTEEFIIKYKDKSPLVKPIITPRFVPSCSSHLLKGLGELALKYDVAVQSHLNENIKEVEWVKELYPDMPNYASVYEKFNLFGSKKTVMAHCIYSKDDEIDLMAKNGVFAAHCVHSNFNLSSGIMPARKFIQKGVNVGLGSDISGGHTMSIPKVIAGTIQASKMKWLETDNKLQPLSCQEAFYLGTKGGGSFFGNVGSFEKGYELDCLIIDDTNLRKDKDLTLEERLERFLYLGDDRNIVARYVSGKLVDSPK